ncbi:MAG: CinA family protein [Bdellovibrionota bacterium]
MVRTVPSVNSYEVNHSQFLARNIVARLKTLGGWLSLAESCTGGLIAHEITQVPGSSGIFYGASVVYHPNFKTQVLRVPKFILHRRGPVSQEVARKMALGAIKLLQSTPGLSRRSNPPLFGLSTTGVAGPGGGSLLNPVGTCWMAMAMSTQEVWVKKVVAPPGFSREANKTLFAKEALEMLHLGIESY